MYQPYALNTDIHTSADYSSMTYRALRTIKTHLSELTLHDAWCTLHPNDKDFSFFSPPHNKYSRIYYFFIMQNNLALLINATIDPMLLSDHNPISMILVFPTAHKKSAIHRLDNSLLTDQEILIGISMRLSQYFWENESTDTTPMTQWAVHKCVIRGELISIGDKRNKARKACIEELLMRIRSLEKNS